MNGRNYYKYCNAILLKNLIFTLALIGTVSQSIICLGFAGIGLIVYVGLTRQCEEIGENEKNLHQLFNPVYIGLVILLIVAFMFYLSIGIYGHNQILEILCYIFFGSFLTLNVVGVFFINWLEKLMYKLKIE